MRVHFIGIGGIGMSALAQYYLASGHQVSGSDLAPSEMTVLLRKKGARIFIGRHKPGNLPKSIDMVIYTPAAPNSNPELRYAHTLSASAKGVSVSGGKRYPLKILSYPEVLGELTKKYFTIAVSGTHGKSTTTAMTALILVRAGLDPTVIVGAKLKEFSNSNFRMGKSKYLVIEADEHFASFLHYWPQMIVLTNIEEDHLDYYKSLKNILGAFRQYIEHLPKDGMLIVNADGKNSKFKIQNSKLHCKIQNYSLYQKEAEQLRRVLQVPGAHNIANALAALSAARALKIPDRISLKALSEYKGAWRRFEIKRFQVSGYRLQVISDYAHHPTEVQATIQAAKERFPGKKIWAVFQPHQLARTAAFFDKFIGAFDGVDAVVLTKIFEVQGREGKKPPKGRDAKALAAEIKKSKPRTYFVPNFRRIPSFIVKKMGKEDVVLIMGAGDIYKINEAKFWN